MKNKIINTYLNGLLQAEVSKQEEDLDEILLVESQCWAENLRAEKEKFGIRQEKDALIIARYIGKTEKILVSGKEKPVKNGQILGHLTAFPAKWTNAGVVHMLYNSGERKWERIVQGFGLPKSWHEAALNGWLERDGISVVGDSDVVFLASMCVAPDYRGSAGGSVIDSLLDSLKMHSKSRGALCIAGYTTLSGYRKFSGQINMSADGYALTNFGGKYISRSIDRHARNGAKIFCAIPKCMPEDLDSKGFGALVVYKL